ncbi:hypothetical protein LDENG_00264420 [Lucifuga dentata]|nr:hypothetical protein LDENG_00264420 [Lucifuga dentata]
MVQLSPSPNLDVSLSPECEERQEEPAGTGSPAVGSPDRLSHLQFTLVEFSTAYHGYDTYIEDGLICLKHKVRNLEKKKLKLEDYKERLKQGETLNKDQMVAVDKYEEVLHNLKFVRELHKTLDGLTQTLLRAQKKAAKREQAAKLEAERRRLSAVLQVQNILLRILQQDHVKRDLLSGLNQAPHVPAQRLNSLIQLATLLRVEKDHRLSLEEEMEQSALVYLDLLEGKDKPVAGSTFKLLKEELTRLMNCEYFTCLPPPPDRTEASQSPPTRIARSKSKPSEVPEEVGIKFVHGLRVDVSTPGSAHVLLVMWQFFSRHYLANEEDFHVTPERESPACWDTDRPASPHAAVHKPWRGAATFIPKVPLATKKQATDAKQVLMDVPVDGFDSPSALPKDPILRKQHLEDLMEKIHGSFSFMQDSLLEGDSPAADGRLRLSRQASGSPAALGNM